MEFNCELNCGMRHWQLDRSHASFLLYLHFIWEQVRFFTIFPCVSGVLFIDISRENKCVIKTHMAYWQLDIREFLSLFLHSNVLSLILFWMRFGLLAERFFPPLCVYLPVIGYHIFRVIYCHRITNIIYLFVSCRSHSTRTRVFH